MKFVSNFVSTLAGTVLLLTAAAAGAQPQALVDQALKAMGGEAALASLKTVSMRGSDQQREYESSFEPGAESGIAPGRQREIFRSTRSHRG